MSEKNFLVWIVFYERGNLAEESMDLFQAGGVSLVFLANQGTTQFQEGELEILHGFQALRLFQGEWCK